MGCAGSSDPTPFNDDPIDEGQKMVALAHELAIAFCVIYSRKRIPFKKFNYGMTGLYNHKRGIFKSPFKVNMWVLLEKDQESKDDFDDIEKYCNQPDEKVSWNYLKNVFKVNFDMEEKIQFSVRDTCLTIMNLGIAIDEGLNVENVKLEFFEMLDSMKSQISDIRPKTLLIQSIKNICEKFNQNNFKKEDEETSKRKAEKIKEGLQNGLQIVGLFL